jgi:hypothetical protein
MSMGGTDDIYGIKLYRTQKSHPSEDMKLINVTANLLCVESPVYRQATFTLTGHFLLPL